MPDKNKKKPNIPPKHTKPVDDITATYATEKRGDEHNWKKHQHDRNEKRQCINTIDPLKGFK